MGGASSQKVSIARKTVVEVGQPHWIHSQAFLRPEEQHVLLNLHREPGLDSASILRTLSPERASRLKFFDAGSGRWPLQPGTAAEVHLPNPSSHRDREVLFNSAARLLKPGGKLFVVEQDPFAFPVRRARELALAAGLTLFEEKSGRKSAVGYQPFARSLRPLPAYLADQRYVLSARRPSLLRSPRKR